MGPRSVARTGPIAVVSVALALGLGACTGTSDNPDLVAGKQQFVAKCGSCHELNRAGTKGTAGPNLDMAFQQSLKDGFPRSGIEGMVYQQILHPATFSAEGGKRVDDSGAMPAELVTGKAAHDVAAYVAAVVARPGKDSGLLAQAVRQAGGGPPARAQGGRLTIPADPNGQLAYVTDRAQAPPGRLTVQSPNRSGTPHDIVIDGKGRGQVVQNGGVSQFSASFDEGQYTYYCSVPGHRQAGMEGRLAVR